MNDPAPADSSTWGDYILEVYGNEPKRHVIIRRLDNARPNPTWYEMEFMKCQALGASAQAIEVYPSIVKLIDGSHQRHLWEIDEKNAYWMKQLIERIGGRE